MKKTIFMLLFVILLASCTTKPKITRIEIPFAGDWSGTARNGDFTLAVIVSINSDCTPGELCGSFDLPSINCRGFYQLDGMEGDVYSFEIVEKSPACGTGKDSMSLQPDGSLLWVSIGNYGENRGLLRPGLLNVNQSEPNAVMESPIALDPERAPLQVIYSDDGSPDGTTALLYLLSDPYASVRIVTIAHGEAHPKIYIQHMGRVLVEFGLSDIPLGYGVDTAIIPGEDFPESLREYADTFWGHAIPNAEETYPAQSAANLIVDTLNQSAEPMAVFISGPCTDLALALRADPGIAQKISGVYIMGGAVDVPGNIADFYPDDPNTYAEWNIYVDPLAAKEIFSSGIPIYLVPLDATNQVSASMADTRQWEQGGQIADLAAEFYSALLNYDDNRQFCLWDVMTAVIMLHPELCTFTPLALDVVTQPGNTLGQTVVVEGGAPNVNVCLQPDAVGIRQMLVYQFAGSN